MITTAEFKKQISPTFGQAMRDLGFKGSGFEYIQENDDFLFSVYISPSRWGGKCTVGLAIHPKQITSAGGVILNVKKLKIYEYEFKFSLGPVARRETWDYKETREENLAIANEMIDVVKMRAMPIVDNLKRDKNLLDEFRLTDLDNFHEKITSKTGISIATTETRFAWAMAIMYEHKDLTKARAFAEYILSRPNMSINFFGNADLERIRSKNNAA
jgi:Domain of unknown function (DUF4304)